VALAGSGTYTFGAFALSASNFWIHVQATIGAVLRRGARFVVTPKQGVARRQPRAIAPALLAVAVLVGASVYGLTKGHGPATLNNVAFAALHSSILLIGAVPAIRLRHSPMLAADEPASRAARRLARHWPRPVWVAALGLVLLVPVLLSTVGTRALRLPATLNQQAYRSVNRFLTDYVTAGGRVVRRDQGGDTVSEGQAYGMLLTVAMDNRARFDSIWGWARTHLLQPDGTLASRWADGQVVSTRPATDADLDAAQALVLASERFGRSSYRDQGVRIARAVLASETASTRSATTPLVLVAGPWARDPLVVDPSYFSPRGYADLARADHDPRWSELVTLEPLDRRAAHRWRRCAAARLGHAFGHGRVRHPRSEIPPIRRPPFRATSSFDALRVAVRYAASCSPADRRLAAKLWPLYYRRNPGPRRLCARRGARFPVLARRELCRRGRGGARCRPPHRGRPAPRTR